MVLETGNVAPLNPKGARAWRIHLGADLRLVPFAHGQIAIAVTPVKR
jgi:hypothetical protein